jgi:hypothetical protein
MKPPKTLLDKLAVKHGTDKYNSHWYTPHYNLHFKKWKNRSVNLLEIGVGGYDNPNVGGQSLRMWKEYFRKGNIYSIDIYDKERLQEDRIKIFRGSQTDASFLKDVCEKMGAPDIIIDDGSHKNEDVISSFLILFPLLKNGGIYVVEDIQTAYWPQGGYGGDSTNLSNPSTSMNFFKGLLDGLNYKEFINESYQPSYYDENIVSMHFYHNLIFVYKEKNNEDSNMVRYVSIDHLSPCYPFT